MNMSKKDRKVIEATAATPNKISRNAAEMRAKYNLALTDEEAREIRKKQQAVSRAEEKLGRKRVG